MMRFIFFLLAIYCAFILWGYIKKKFVASREGKETLSSTPKATELVQDPECGVYFAKDKGLKINIKGRALYFCSEACKDKYIRKIEEAKGE